MLYDVWDPVGGVMALLGQVETRSQRDPGEGMPLRIHILSDLHIEHGGFIARREPCDVVVVAGDLAHGQGMAEAIRHLDRQLQQPWIYVPGNHDWYGLDLVSDRRLSLDRWRQAGERLHLLDDRSWIVAVHGTSYRCIGSTWWSAMDWTPDDRPTFFARQIAASTASQHVNDFRFIRHDGEVFTPDHARSLHELSTLFIRQEVTAALAAGEVPIVVTHFLPTRRSIDPAYSASPLNGYFANDRDDLTAGVPLWIHGHTHASCDYVVPSTGCRVVCNPKGYGRENSAFIKNLVVTVEPPA
ncbi:MAG: metallophosphoesterase [Planctomycetes bacterium]|nr:metallophosphoesterase [Planctomycetota bacterium]